MNRYQLVSILAGLMLVSQAQAERGHHGHGNYGGHDRIERRQERQHRRIEKGIHNGQLTRREAKKLWRQHHKIAKLERRFSRDGWLSRKERYILRDRLDHASDRIRDFKHNHRVKRNHYDRHNHKRDHYASNGYYEKNHYNPYNRFTTRSNRYGSGIYINW